MELSYVSYVPMWFSLNFKLGTRNSKNRSLKNRTVLFSQLSGLNSPLCALCVYVVLLIL